MLYNVYTKIVKRIYKEDEIEWEMSALSQGGSKMGMYSTDGVEMVVLFGQLGQGC